MTSLARKVPAALGGRGPAGWLFMAPSLLILGTFVLFPIGRSLWYSLHNWTVGAAEQPWAGLDNYTRLFGDAQFQRALANTLIITVASTAVLVVVGLGLALALQSENVVSRVVRSVFFFPTVISLTTVGMVWRFLLDPDIGLVGGVTRALGLDPVNWLQSTALALPTVIFVNVWKNAGFVMIVLVAGLKAIPGEHYEAASLDGAGRLQTLRSITLPALRPTMLFVTFMVTVQSLQLFDLVYVMTSGGPLDHTETLVTKLYRDGFVNYETGYAAATSWVLFIVVVLVSALQLRIFRYNDAD
ncbi:multiple sugar transport system permease protein/raffinose/stachyose/melibiose transport system permease protein [Actinoplanes tereljensis]|uniref:Sugar ABC transporter permease n=1 Tax=Paractinoplanes tereljensis TaxID=571912 RepID=A0A919NQF0_9ACTN|nr:sugar ABC transporter permease [Actinoplanes tereljensis]GIF22763.1 sugar ABC transporter permease [Actinoplanes tereljensis]